MFKLVASLPEWHDLYVPEDAPSELRNYSADGGGAFVQHVLWEGTGANVSEGRRPVVLLITSNAFEIEKVAAVIRSKLSSIGENLVDPTLTREQSVRCRLQVAELLKGIDISHYMKSTTQSHQESSQESPGSRSRGLLILIFLGVFNSCAVSYLVWNLSRSRNGETFVSANDWKEVHDSLSSIQGELRARHSERFGAALALGSIQLFDSDTKLPPGFISLEKAETLNIEEYPDLAHWLGRRSGHYPTAGLEAPRGKVYVMYVGRKTE